MTMLEKVARAVDEALNDNSIAFMKPSGVDSETVRQCREADTKRAFRAARAAIEAMREPTEAMVEADMPLGGYGFGDDVYSADPKEVWQAMIDAALAEKPQT